MRPASGQPRRTPAVDRWQLKAAKRDYEARYGKEAD